jgi:hypothetical protein
MSRGTGRPHRTADRVGDDEILKVAIRLKSCLLFKRSDQHTRHNLSLWPSTSLVSSPADLIAWWSVVSGHQQPPVIYVDSFAAVLSKPAHKCRGKMRGLARRPDGRHEPFLVRILDVEEPSQKLIDSSLQLIDRCIYGHPYGV